MTATASRPVVIDRAVLKDALAAVSAATTHRGALPALAGVLLEADGALLTVTADDLDLRLQATVPLLVDDADMTAVISRRVLSKMIRSGGPTVTLTHEPSDDHDGGTLTVEPDDGMVVTLRCLPPGDAERLAAPEPAVPFGVELTPDDVADVATLTRFASSNNSRPVLCGIGVDGGGLWAATDAYRLATLALPDTADVLGDTIVPSRLWQQVAAWQDPDPVAVARTDWPHHDHTVRVSGCRVRSGRVVQVVAHSLTVDGTFPTVGKLIPDPADTDVEVVLDHARLVRTLDTCRQIAGFAANAPVELTADVDQVDLHTGVRDIGTVDATVAVKQRTGPAEPRRTAFNPTYFAEIVDALADGGDPTVTIRIRDHLKPAVITGPSRITAILMPMRVDR